MIHDTKRRSLCQAFGLTELVTGSGKYILQSNCVQLRAAGPRVWKLSCSDSSISGVMTADAVPLSSGERVEAIS
jgi:hypothetical protein